MARKQRSMKKSSKMGSSDTQKTHVKRGGEVFVRKSTLTPYGDRNNDNMLFYDKVTYKKARYR